MYGKGRGSGRGITRRVMLLAVLAGLFFMHGTVMGAAGCQGGMPTSAPMAATMPLAAAYPVVPAPQHTVQAAPQAHGAMCAAIPPRTEPFVPAVTAALLLLGALVTPAPRRGFSRRQGARGPPLWGAGLLVRLCISRT
jgi:hypothetical protein